MTRSVHALAGGCSWSILFFDTLERRAIELPHGCHPGSSIAPLALSLVQLVCLTKLAISVARKFQAFAATRSLFAP